MSARLLTAIIFALLVIAPVRSWAASCQVMAAPGWSEQLRQLFPDCENDIASPDGKLNFHIGPAEKIAISRSSGNLRFDGRERLGLPSVLSWSPNSKIIALNDGNGSGIYSQLRIMRINDGLAKEDRRPNRLIISEYRKHFYCAKSADNPNVYAAGWSEDSNILYIVAQATVNSPCGRPESYLGFALDLRKDAIFRVLTAADAKREWKQILPQELR